MEKYIVISSDEMVLDKKVYLRRIRETNKLLEALCILRENGEGSILKVIEIEKIEIKENN